MPALDVGCRPMAVSLIPARFPFNPLPDGYYLMPLFCFNFSMLTEPGPRMAMLPMGSGYEP